MKKNKTTAKPKEPKVKLPRERTTLVGEPGAKLTVVAAQLTTKPGEPERFRTSVVHRVEKQSVRGMQTFWPSFVQAVEAKAKLVSEAVALGWKAVEKAKRTPAFAVLPAPNALLPVKEKRAAKKTKKGATAAAAA